MNTQPSSFESPKRGSSSTYRDLVALIKHINSTPRSLKQTGDPILQNNTVYQPAIGRIGDASNDVFCSDSEVTDWTLDHETESFSVQITPFQATPLHFLAPMTPKMPAVSAFSPRGIPFSQDIPISRARFFSDFSLSTNERIAGFSQSYKFSIDPVFEQKATKSY